jgi:exodeoxyribonuclease VII small subunit
MKQLEHIARELEAGELPLETAMKKFEEGIQLSRFCAKKLDETEQRISVLIRDAEGAVQEVPFEEKSSDEDTGD